MSKFAFFVMLWRLSANDQKQQVVILLLPKTVCSDMPICATSDTDSLVGMGQRTHLGRDKIQLSGMHPHKRSRVHSVGGDAGV